MLTPLLQLSGKDLEMERKIALCRRVEVITDLARAVRGQQSHLTFEKVPKVPCSGHSGKRPI